MSDDIRAALVVLDNHLAATQNSAEKLYRSYTGHDELVNARTYQEAWFHAMCNARHELRAFLASYDVGWETPEWQAT